MNQHDCHHHIGEYRDSGDRGQQAEGHQQPAKEFDNSHCIGPKASRLDPETLDHADEALHPRTTKPTRDLLSSVSGDRQASDRPQQQNAKSDHFIHLLFGTHPLRHWGTQTKPG
jgi:hypothetical protein